MFRKVSPLHRLVRGNMDWVKLAGRASAGAAKGELTRLRAAYDELEGEVSKAHQAVKPIDWAQYEKAISSPDLVAAFKKEYEGLQYPTYSDDVESKTEQEFKTLLAEAAEVKKGSEARAAELEELLASLLAHRTTRDTTIDEVGTQFPHLDVEIKQEDKNHQWSKGVL